MRSHRASALVVFLLAACAVPSSDEANGTGANDSAAQGAERRAVETTASGLRFQVIEEGTGPLITPADAIVMRFRMQVEKGSVIVENETSGDRPL